jgi:mRNA interferase HigB
MRVIAVRALREFWRRSGRGDAERPLRAWFREAKRAGWHSPNEIKKVYANASILAGNRIVFNIAGNKYRLVVKINYPYGVVYIRFIGTHKEYDGIDVETI